MRNEIDLCYVQLATGNETNSCLDQEFTTLVIELLAARRLRDSMMEEWILSRLDHEYGVKLTFASEVEKQNIVAQPKMTDNPAILERYYLKMIAPEMDGHKRVPMIVFREKPLSDAEYDRILSPLTTTGLLRTAVDETFSLSEVELLKEFFTEVVPTWEFSATPATPIRENSFGSVVCGCVFGKTGTIHWPHEETGKFGPQELPIGVYYDLRAAEAEPCIDDLAVRSKFCEQKGVHCE